MQQPQTKVDLVVTDKRDTDSKAASQPPQKPTLRTIAQITGLAVPTVSRALSGATDISQATRARVRKIADEIGYVPNRAGVRLRTGRTNVISLVLATDHDMMNHTARLITAIAGRLRATSFHLIITPYFPDEDPMKPIRYIVETGSADAVIFNQIQPQDPRVDYLMSRQFPFSTHGRSDQCATHAYYDFDNGAFGRVGVQDMAARGRKDLILIAPPQDQTYSRDMMNEARAEAVIQGVDLEVLKGVTSDDSHARIEAAMSARLAERPSIDGVICGSTNSAMVSVTALENRGATVGTDVDIFAKEAIRFLKQFRSPIRTLHEDVSAAGEFLAQAAMARVAYPQIPPMQFLEVPEREDVV